MSERDALDQRRPRERESAYLGWVARLPCLACLSVTGKVVWGVQVAHYRAGILTAGWRPTGMGEKPDDRRSAPLCVDHHLNGPDAQHRIGEHVFWKSYLAIDPVAFMEGLWHAYDNNLAGLPVVARFAAIGRRAREQGGANHG